MGKEREMEVRIGIFVKLKGRINGRKGVNLRVEEKKRIYKFG